jgi:hypothetical protein
MRRLPGRDTGVPEHECSHIGSELIILLLRRLRAAKSR